MLLFQEKDSITVVNDQWGSPTYAKDLAQFVMKVLNSGSNEYGVYHFTNEGRTCWYDFARYIYDVARGSNGLSSVCEILPVGSDSYPSKAKRPQYSYMSKEKAKHTFHIDIRSWQDAVKSFLLEEVLCES